MADKKIDTRREVKIDLDFPFEFDGQTIDSFTMRRPKVKDSLKASKAKGGALEIGLALFADLCDCAPEMFHEMDEVDVEKVKDQYAAFTGRDLTSEG